MNDVVRECSAQLSSTDWLHGGGNPDFSLRLRCGMVALILVLRLHVHAGRVIDLSYGELPASDGKRAEVDAPVHHSPNSCDAASHCALACSFRNPPSNVRRSHAFPLVLLRLASGSPAPAIAALPVNAPRNCSLLPSDIYPHYQNAMRQRHSRLMVTSFLH